jgi:hypothetical protein
MYLEGINLTQQLRESCHLLGGLESNIVIFNSRGDLERVKVVRTKFKSVVQVQNSRMAEHTREQDDWIITVGHGRRLRG